MFAQPLRLGGLALAYAAATATVVLVTVVASNLLLSVVAVLGPRVDVVQQPAPGTFEQVRLAADDAADDDADDDVDDAPVRCPRCRTGSAVHRSEPQRPRP